MDPMGWIIAVSHQLLGHDKAAAVLGVPPYPRGVGECLICRYERTHAEADRLAVLAALTPEGAPDVPR